MRSRVLYSGRGSARHQSGIGVRAASAGGSNMHIATQDRKMAAILPTAILCMNNLPHPSRARPVSAPALNAHRAVFRTAHHTRQRFADDALRRLSGLSPRMQGDTLGGRFQTELWFQKKSFFGKKTRRPISCFPKANS